MQTLNVTDRAHDMVRFAARAVGVTESDVIERAIAAVLREADERPPADPWQPVPVYATYEGRRIDGEYLPATGRLVVGDVSYKSPSGAARAVVTGINPARASTQTNGWRWWRLAATHERLQAIR